MGTKRDRYQLLGGIGHHVFVIDREYRVLYSNRRSQRDEGEYCFKLFWNRDEVCEACGLHGLVDRGEVFSKSGMAHFMGSGFLAHFEYRRMGDEAVCVAEDKSQMVDVLKRIKEKETQDQKRAQSTEQKLNAQIVILKNKLRVAQKEIKRLPEVLDGISSGVLVIDQKKIILQKNRRLGEVLAPFWANAPLDQTHCYQALWGLDEICEGCPVQGVTPKVGKHTRRIKTELGEGYLTEEFTSLADSVVISVSNSTRTIELAMNIQKNQAEMESLNHILREVMAAAVEMQTISDVDELFAKALEILDRTLLNGERVPCLIVQNHPSNRNIERVAFRNTPEEEGKNLVKMLQKRESEWFSSQGYRVELLQGRDGKASGMLMIKAADLEERRANILSIFVSMVGSLTENLRLMADLERQASVDGLTGTFNRAYFDRRFEAEREKAARLGLSFGLVVLDINGLKKVNDVYGHFAGDAMIIESGKLLRAQVREEDVLSRFGGDEFVVLLPATDGQGTRAVMERIKAIQKDATYCFQGDDGVKITQALHMSAGCASSDEVDVSKVFQVADERMYEDKQEYYRNHAKYR